MNRRLVGKVRITVLAKSTPNKVTQSVDKSKNCCELYLPCSGLSRDFAIRDIEIEIDIRPKLTKFMMGSHTAQAEHSPGGRNEKMYEAAVTIHF